MDHTTQLKRNGGGRKKQMHRVINTRVPAGLAPKVSGLIEYCGVDNASQLVRQLIRLKVKEMEVTNVSNSNEASS